MERDARGPEPGKPTIVELAGSRLLPEDLDLLLKSGGVEDSTALPLPEVPSGNGDGAQTPEQTPLEDPSP